MRAFKPKNPKNLVSGILKDGYTNTAKRHGISRNLLARTIKKYYPATHARIVADAKKRSCAKSKNTFFFCEKYIYILIKDKVCIANIRFASKIIKYSWCLSHGYAQANINNKRKTMHRYLYSKKDGLVTDHKNRNKLDNRIKNIRFVSHSFNVMNAVRLNNSGYRGVSWSYHCNKTNSWMAKLEYKGIVYYLGYFPTAVDAFNARVKKEIEMFGHEVLL